MTTFAAPSTELAFLIGTALGWGFVLSGCLALLLRRRK